MTTPHDAYTKFAFSEVVRATQVLVAAIGARLAALIDWSSLAPEPTELVDEALGVRFP